MTPYIFWHWNRLPTLREADDKIRSFAERGFGIVIMPEKGFLTSAFFEALRGACRSAGRYGAQLAVADDCAGFSGCGGGEVTSVPEFRARLLTLVSENEVAADETPLLIRDGQAVVVRRAVPEGGLCPADVFNPRAVKAFADSVYRRLIRETPRFLGHELVAIYTKEPFPDGALPYSEELMRRAEEENITVESIFFGEDKERYAALSNHLGAEALHPVLKERCEAAGLRLMSPTESSSAEKISVLDFTPDGQHFYSDALRALALGFGGGDAVVEGEGVEPIDLPFNENRPCVAFDSLWTAAACRLDRFTKGLEMNDFSAEADREEIKINQLAGKDAALYIFANSGNEAVSCKCSVADSRPAYVFDFVSGELYSPGAQKIEATLERGGSLAVLCSGESISAAPMPKFIRTGAVFSDLGKGEELTAETIEEGAETAVYELSVPELSENGGLLCLNGSFACAEVRIGRRREKLIAPPFLMPLFASDAGRKAEITLYSAMPAPEFVDEFTDKTMFPVLNSVCVM
ncbi:MAG: hypothetical protein J1F63_09355 [Oscillospiraceae bacterium]|nr:hypothetical protein [Oscillospiraceae bacterium]